MLRTISLDEKITIKGKIIKRLPSLSQNLDLLRVLTRADPIELCDFWWIVTGTPIQYAFVPKRWRKHQHQPKKGVDKKSEMV